MTLREKLVEHITESRGRMCTADMGSPTGTREFLDCFGRIVEGQCPDCHETLVVLSHPNIHGGRCGVCPECGDGWQARTLAKDDPRRERMGDRIVTVIPREWLASRCAV